MHTVQITDNIYVKSKNILNRELFELGIIINPGI